MGDAPDRNSDQQIYTAELVAVEELPLVDRAAGFEALHDRLLTELQQDDHGE